MLVADFIKISLETLKVMSKNNIMLSDRDLINAYDDFIELRSSGMKYSVAVTLVAEKYHKSERTISRFLSRVQKELIVE